MLNRLCLLLLLAICSCRVSSTPPTLQAPRRIPDHCKQIPQLTLRVLRHVEPSDAGECSHAPDMAFRPGTNTMPASTLSVYIYLPREADRRRWWARFESLLDNTVAVHHGGEKTQPGEYRLVDWTTLETSLEEFYQTDEESTELVLISYGIERLGPGQYALTGSAMNVMQPCCFPPSDSQTGSE